MSKRDPKLLVGDILDSAKKILEYTNDLPFEEFTKDGKTVDAVIGNPHFTLANIFKPSKLFLFYFNEDKKFTGCVHALFHQQPDSTKFRLRKKLY